MKKQKHYSITLQILQEKELESIISYAKEDLKYSIDVIDGTPDDIITDLREVTNQIFTKYKPDINSILGDNSIRKIKNCGEKTVVKISNNVKRLQLLELEFYQLIRMFEYSDDEILDLYYDLL